jgi:AcrR family transcriptional regulator
MSKGEATRQSILGRATALASEVGLAGLTIGRLADDLGLSKSGLFAHFRSKEALEVQVLDHATQLFVANVLKPAFRAPRGEPRLRALIARLLDWPENGGLPGGCPILGAAAELDDRPGPARDALVAQQTEWLTTLANLARVAVAEGHFHKRLAAEGAQQFAFEFYGIQAAYHHLQHLLQHAHAREHAQTAYDGLLARSKG